jgi:drug/metabolite transporter (DMT)-like permease
MITSAALAVYLIELLKRALPNVEFSPKVMAGLLVLANAVAALMLAVLGVEGYSLPTDWVAWAKVLIVAVISAVVSSALYVVGYLPFKAYAQAYKQYRNGSGTPPVISTKKSVLKKK